MSAFQRFCYQTRFELRSLLYNLLQNEQKQQKKSKKKKGTTPNNSFCYCRFWIPRGLLSKWKIYSQAIEVGWFGANRWSRSFIFLQTLPLLETSLLMSPEKFHVYFEM